MSDAMAERVANEQAATPGIPEGKSVTLSVTLHPNGQIDFQLPMGNKILAYGLVETARAQLDKLFLMHELKSAPPRNGVGPLRAFLNGKG